MDAQVRYSLVSVVVLGLVLVLRKPWRTKWGLVAGLVLFSTSLFHLLFGEGSVHDYALYSWPWWSDTYEVTVQMTYVALLILYSWSVRAATAMLVPNLAYLAAGALYFWLLSPKADGIIAYNALGLFIGSMWMMERVSHRSPPAHPRRPLSPVPEEDPDSDPGGKPLTATW
jgi:hypothetical protein